MPRREPWIPAPPLWITDGQSFGDSVRRYKARREALIAHWGGPLIFLGPGTGPNRHYEWATCYQPVYQTSDLLFLTGINQTDLRIILESRAQHVFLPNFSQEKQFWEGRYLGYGDPNTHDFLAALGFTDIHPIASFYSLLKSRIHPSVTWGIPITRLTRHGDEHHQLCRYIKRHQGQSACIGPHMDATRVIHDEPAIQAITAGIAKTAAAFDCVLAQHPYASETQLAGTLVGELLRQTPYGLAFSPIVATNQNAAILHYTDNSAAIASTDMILMDFGLRWGTMCTDVSRTIPAGKTYSPIQRALMGLVLDTQAATIERIRAGVTLDALDQFAWSFLEDALARLLKATGGHCQRPYTHKPHTIGHLLGIQVHDGDAHRAYRHKPLPPHSIITIEPGIYGTFTMYGETVTIGIRIEDNVLILPNENRVLTQAIPKTCDAIEARLKQR
jgi:Xaa-Pro aminopeptidase